MPLILPGLLQTEAYIEALLRTGPRPPQWRRKALEARLRRQEILDRSDGTAPKLTAVITEASLLYRWGTGSDRQEQVAHLIELARYPGVELRVQRFQDGPPSGAFSMINLFGFGGQDPSLVFVETDYTIEEVNKREAVNGYVQSFKRACDGRSTPATRWTTSSISLINWSEPMIDLSQADWRKARRSAHNGGCVEIAANLDGVTAVRDSKRPEGGAHVVDRAVFATFLADVKDGRYDI